MSTPEHHRLDQAFADLADAAAVMADPPATAMLRRRVRRRRALRGAAAAATAVLVAAPAVWLLQPFAGEEPPPADPAPLATYGDLVDASIDLPSFYAEGHGTCRGEGPVTLAGGADGNPGIVPYEEAGEFPPDGPTLVKVIHAPLEEGGPASAVALVRCWSDGPEASQVLVIEPDGAGGWAVADRLLTSVEAGAALANIAVDPAYGVVVLMEPPLSEYSEDQDLTRFVRLRPFDAEPRVELEVPEAPPADLSFGFHRVEDPDGTWAVTAEVENTGEQATAATELLLCGNQQMWLDGVELPECGDDPVLLEVGPLEPGEAWTSSWTLVVDEPMELHYGVTLFAMAVAPVEVDSGLVHGLYGSYNKHSMIAELRGLL
ncbi:hypothetical protein [Glycomyces paridis]|uniref:Uncharacterized protein n=1 Tax=Glycomyces paridis TaxID=2126555 RepID=A0A4S8NWM5_9ACTN|nr:hypothetical protein [Glycomyces paridis]THV22063.1 hypothetical protein E9998_23885 [Glycomyces paridis]